MLLYYPFKTEEGKYIAEQIESKQNAKITNGTRNASLEEGYISLPLKLFDFENSFFSFNCFGGDIFLMRKEATRNQKSL